MKLNLILTAALLGSVSLASAQRPGGKGPGGRGPGGKGGEAPAPAEMVKHLSERFAALAAFDTDKSGKLEESEQTAVAKAIDDGSLEMGPPRGKGGKGPKEGPGGKPPGDKAARHAAKLYESLAPFDADKSGSLDATEQAAVVKGIEDGSLKLPRPGGPGGPGGRHEDGPPPPPEGGR